MGFPTQIACGDCGKVEQGTFDIRPTITGCTIDCHLPSGWKGGKLPFPGGVGFRCSECSGKLTRLIVEHVKTTCKDGF